jgi:hypothetical protein
VRVQTTEEILEELRQDFRTIDNLQQDAPTQNKAAEQMKADLVNACIGGDDKTVQQIVRGNVGALTATDLGEALIVTCRFQTNVRDDIALLLIQVHALSLTLTHTHTQTTARTHVEMHTHTNRHMMQISFNNRMELTSI